MYRPSFRVVTGVLVALVSLAVATKLLSPLVPPPAPNGLAGSRDDFLIQGSREPIDWQVMGDAAFARARHDQKPILFVIGAPWSAFARRMDDMVFSDPDVARYLNQNYLCVRVDAAADRKWLSAYLPFSRLTYGIQPGFQAWILDCHGQMLDLIGRISADQVLDSEAFLAALIDGHKLVDRVARDEPTPIVPDQGQRADISVLEQSPRRVLPFFERYALDLRQRISRRYGGFPRNGIQPLQPNAWRYLILSGHPTEAREAIEPVLFSPMADLVDGGFFRLSVDSDIRTIDFDKVATVNAEAAQVLALMGYATKDPVYRYYGSRAFDTVTTSLLAYDGLVATCLPGIEGRDRRSESHSFGLAHIADSLSEPDAAWARRRLSLDPADNPQMIPYFASRADLLDEPLRRERILAQLKSRTKSSVRLAGTDSAEAHCHSVARLLEAARAWGDAERLVRLAPLVASAEAYRRDSQVVPRSDATRSSDYLGDWLAYADVELQDFLTNGRVISLDHGADVLEKALALFEGDAPGEYSAGAMPDRELWPQNASAPEVADNIQESCSARVIRLCHAYGALLGDTPRGTALKRRAYATADLYSTVLQDAGPFVAGYFCACHELRDDVFALSVGPNAVAMANELYRSAPTRLVAPAIGPVGKEFRARPPGIYLVRMAKVEGPLSTEEAARLLSSPRA